MNVSLSRPALPELSSRVRWPRSIAVFGSGAVVFAETLAGALGARLVRVELRHAEGWSASEDGRVFVHPSALGAAMHELRSNASSGFVVGVGSAFAAAVEADLAVAIAPASLAPSERRLARDARLVLEEARIGTALALAEALAGSAGPLGL
jgi:hypothetical protein